MATIVRVKFSDVIAPCVYVVHVISVWNTLPVDHVDFSSFAAFKRTVQQIDLSMFLLCY